MVFGRRVLPALTLESPPPEKEEVRKKSFSFGTTALGKAAFFSISRGTEKKGEESNFPPPNNRTLYFKAEEKKIKGRMFESPVSCS